nr:zinc-ribbon domain-containing protein [Clostridia bacterium]
MKCTVCGAELPEGAAFCNDCGNPIRQGAPSPADAAPSAQSCPRCGAQARPEATFCPACGYRMKAAASPAQPAQPAPPVQPYTQPYAQPYPPQPAQPYAPPTQQPAPYPYVQPAQPYAQQPGYYAQQPGYYAQQPAARPAKKRKGALVAVIIVLLLAVIGAGTYFLFGKQIKRLVLGDKYAYALIEQKNLKDDFEKLVDAAARIGNLEERAAAGGHSIGLQADVDEAGLGLDAQTAAAIGGITLQDDLGIQWVSGKPVYYNALGLAVGDERLMTLQIYTEGDSILIGLPEVLDSYIRIDPAALAGATGGSVDAASATMLLDLVTSLDLAIDRGELENSLMEVTKILLDHIDETTFERGRELTVGSVTGTYDAYTVTLGSESAKAMVIGILEFARGDDALYNLIGRVMSLSEGGSYEPVDRAEYESRMDEAIADMEAEEITDPFTMI